MRWHFIRIYTKLHMRKLRGQAHWLCQSPGGLPPLRQARPAPAQRNQASESILDAGQGARKSRGRSALSICECAAYLHQKKRTSHERFVSASGVRSTKPQLSRFGAMILDAGQGARKRRGRSVLSVREGAAYSEATQPRAKSIRQIRSCRQEPQRTPEDARTRDTFEGHPLR